MMGHAGGRQGRTGADIEFRADPAEFIGGIASRRHQSTAESLGGRRRRGDDLAGVIDHENRVTGIRHDPCAGTSPQRDAMSAFTHGRGASAAAMAVACDSVWRCACACRLARSSTPSISAVSESWGRPHRVTRAGARRNARRRPCEQRERAVSAADEEESARNGGAIGPASHLERVRPPYAPWSLDPHFVASFGQREGTGAIRAQLK